MDEPWKHDVKWNKPFTKGQTLYDFTYMKYLQYSFIVTENRMEVTGAWGGGENRELLFNG